MDFARASVGHSVALSLLLLACAQAVTALAETKVRTSSFEYDAAGLLVQEKVEPDSPADCLQTSTSYDAYGNKTSVSLAACAGASGNALASAGTARTATTTYGTDGRFALGASNSLGQGETRQYDPRFGAVTSLTGPNGLTTTWQYDSLGRKTRETRADGTYTTWTYGMCAAPGAACPGPIGAATLSWVAVEQGYASNGSPSSSQKRQYHDVLGRVVRVQTTGFDGAGAGPVLVQDTEYDNLGRVARQSSVYAAIGGNPNWTAFSYDALGRVTSETAPNPYAAGGTATTAIAYDGLATTVTNSMGQRKTTLKDAQGQVARVTDHQGNTVAYTYDALGQLVQTNASGSITTLTYDQRGRKVGMIDPAMGSWQYAYNVHGELVWQRDSLGRVATMTYDALGRMTERTEADLVSQWSFDRKFDLTPCGKGIGKLCEAKADNGYRRVHAYDALGRPSSTATVLDNPALPATVSVAYEAATGRVASKTWPTGYQASYQYTAAGYLQKVTAGGSGGFSQTVTFEVSAMDAKGHVTQYKQGGQVTTVRAYDDATGRLKTVTATRNGFASAGVLAHAYTYDSLGNLVARIDNSPGAGTQEGFTYDTLNRLQTYTILGGAIGSTQTTDVTYDPRGNILFKSDVGRYWYDPDRPNRLTNITLDAPPGMATTGTATLSYGFDDTRPGAQTVNGVTFGNGNLMFTVTHDTVNNRHTYRGETYTSFNMPAQFTYSNFVNGAATTADRVLSFVYGPEHQRIKQQVQLTSNAPTAYSAGVTWYLNGADGQALTYEKEIKDSGITEHKHYVEAAGVVFALFVSRTGNLAGQPATSIRYFHHDHLGSVAAISDEAGQVIERLAYDPWGKRRKVDGTRDAPDAIVGWNTDRGFTMHEHLDEMGIIHMNGRVYDPLIGRFMSADPFIQSPGDLQSYNRYAYVSNNPLAFTDPSGYFKLRKLVRAIAAIVVAYYAPGLFAQYGVSVAGMSAATATTINAVAAGALAGAIASGNLNGALTGALSAGLFTWAGGVVSGTGGVAGYAAHAVAGCIASAAGGGDCGAGAASGVFGKFASVYIGSSELLAGQIAAGIATAVAGGIGSVLAGGKFENGAVTATFGYLFNALGGKQSFMRGVRGFASMVSDLASADFQLVEPEVWGRTGSGERFRVDGIFVQAQDGRTMIGGAVVVCEAKCGPTAELSARQARVYDAIARNDFHMEGPRALKVADELRLQVDSAGHVRVPSTRFAGAYLGVYEGSAAHLKPRSASVNWGAIFQGAPLRSID